MRRLWNLACGRRLHAQQQEFLTVYECVDKVDSYEVVLVVSKSVNSTGIPVVTSVAVPDCLLRPPVFLASSN